jgi:hypothetical protein
MEVHRLAVQFLVPRQPPVRHVRELRACGESHDFLETNLTMTLKRLVSLFGATALAGCLFLSPPCAFAQEAGQASTATDIETLKKQLMEEQKQIDQLRLMIEDQKKAIEKAQEAEQAKAANAAPAPQHASLGEVASASPILPPGGASSASTTGLSPQAGPMDADDAGPLYFKIGSARFAPLGFVDVTSVFRSTNTGNGIGTGFNGIPPGNTVAGNNTENRFSLQNSRFGLRVDSDVLGGHVIGYLETDFLGNAPTNLLVTSNSNTLRMRLYWVDWRKGKFEFLGGQTWSLLTPNRKGLSPMPSDVFYSLDMDTNYQLGLVWSRAPEFRFVYHANDNVTAGFALANPEQYVGNAVTYPTLLSSALSSQFSTGSSNSNAPNLTPDIIAKIAFDGTPGGKAAHLEIGGVLSTFQAYDPLTGAHNRAAGGSGEINANLEVAKGFNLIANTFAGAGAGRYIFGLAPDVVIKPNGQIDPVKTASTVGGFEWTTQPKDNPKGLSTLWYGYYGGLYVDRAYYLDTNGKFEGYGFPGSANAANRAIQEATFGVIQTFWKNPMYGDLKLITQYSYLTRNPWAPVTGVSAPHSHMVWIDLRYDLP